MSLANILAKYSYALIKHAPHLARLAYHRPISIEKISREYFGTANLLSDEEIYQAMPPWFQNPKSLLLNFFPLPASLEKRWYGQSHVDIHHRARLELIRTILPKAKRILDLGGADSQSPAGALLAMGYPHDPTSLHIVDLPPDLRVHDPSSLEAIEQVQHNHTKVTYSYHTMSDLEQLAGNTFDMIWMGQTVEHILQKDLEKILVLADDLLAENGSFCLDTPNRHITRLLNPLGLIHPDHKLEYKPEQLEKIFIQNGYHIQERLALNPLPLSRRTGMLHRLELFTSPNFGPDPRNGFSFYTHFRRNSAINESTHR